MPRFSSRQEELVNALMSQVAGAAYMFPPIRIKDGLGVQEPADLAWVCRESAVLFYLTHSPNRSFDAAKRHNFRRAENWMIRWRAGAPLCGRNRLHSVSVAYEDVTHVVVISVVTSRAERSEYDTERTRDFNVAAAGTFTERDVRCLASVGASMFDLIAILDRMKNADSSAVGIVADYISKCCGDAFSVSGLDQHPSNDLDVATARNVLISPRLPNDKGVTGPTGDNRLWPADVFVELTLFETWRLIYACVRLMRRIWRPPRGAGFGFAYTALNLEGIRFEIVVASPLEKLAEHIDVEYPNPLPAGHEATVARLMIALTEDFVHAIWAIPSRSEVSRMKLALEFMRRNGW